MIVTFRTEDYADITMFGDVAVSLLHMMGHSGTIPGAIAPEDVPAALAQLREGVEASYDDEPPAGDADDDGDEPPVTLPQRAFPLIELMEAAVASRTSVMWKKG